jgi:Tol biopolymer transport system component
MTAGGTDIEALTVGDPGNTEPFWSSMGHIAYGSTRAGNFDIWLKSASDTNDGINLTASYVENDAQPRVSPDGTMVAFSSRRDGPDTDIFVMDTNGVVLVQLTQDDIDQRYPTWSPDGQYIAYEHLTGGVAWDIYVMSAVDGSGKTNLTNVPASSDSHPHWGYYIP